MHRIADPVVQLCDHAQVEADEDLAVLHEAAEVLQALHHRADGIVLVLVLGFNQYLVYN